MSGIAISENVGRRGAVRPLNYPQMFGGGLFFLIASAAASHFRSALAGPFAFLGATHLFTVASVKIIYYKYPDKAKEVLTDAIGFKERYPHLQAVAFAVTLIGTYIWPAIGCFFGMIAGFYSGLLIKADYLKDLQTTYKEIDQPLHATLAQS